MWVMGLADTIKQVYRNDGLEQKEQEMTFKICVFGG